MAKKSGLNITTGRVYGDGPFVEIGTPTALDTDEDLVVIGGGLGRTGSSTGVYDRQDLRCRGAFLSRWAINDVAIHPSGRLIAAGTGSYDGGYSFDGELLIHDLERRKSVCVLERMVVGLSWQDPQTLRVVLAPEDDHDGADFADLELEHLELRHHDWTVAAAPGVEKRAAGSGPDVAQWWAEHDASTTRLHQELTRLAAAHGQQWHLRRPAWTVVPTDDGVVVGSGSGIERWGDGDVPVWHAAPDQECTRLFAEDDSSAVATVRPARPQVGDRGTMLLVDLATGGTKTLAKTAQGVSLACRNGNEYLVPRQHGFRTFSYEFRSAKTRHAHDTKVAGHEILDIRHSPEFLVLDDKRFVVQVSQAPKGWRSRRLFPLAWKSGGYVSAGPGVWLDDAGGPAVVYAGSYGGHSPFFVVRRRYPTGDVQWCWEKPRCDPWRERYWQTGVTSVDEHEGVVLVTTAHGLVVAIDAITGQVLGSDRLHVHDVPVSPLSMVLCSPRHGWVSTSDGRAVEIFLA